MSYLDKAAFYFASEPHQIAAWQELEASLSPAQLERFKEAYRATQEESDHGSSHLLDVPYYYQRDSQTGHGERMCFSSSMAMAMDYLDPEAIEGDDDWYLSYVFKYGDSVSSEAQLAAARELGFDVDFYTDLGEQDIIDQINRGFPVPIGILHRGTIDAATGGGHWICVIGYDEEDFHVHDPFGELALISGNYTIDNGPEAGKFQKYSRKNLLKRWSIAGDNDGWGMIFK